MDKSFGEFLKNLRLSHAITRKQLCDGICSEKQLFRIESNQSEPSVYLLNHLSARLNIDLNEYYKKIYCHTSITAGTFSRQICECIEKMHFEELPDLIQRLGAIPSLSSNEDVKYLAYAKAVLSYYHQEPLEQTLALCMDSLRLDVPDFHFPFDHTHLFSNSGYGTLNLTASIYHKMGKPEESLCLLHSLEASLSYNYSSENYINYHSLAFIDKLYQNTLYRIAFSYQDINSAVSLKYINKGLAFSFEKSVLRLLPELLKLKYLLLNRLEHTEGAKELLQCANTLQSERTYSNTTGSSIHSVFTTI